MYKTNVTRRELLDLVQVQSSKQLDLGQELREGRRPEHEVIYTLIWDREEPRGELPSAVLIPQTEQEDFFAWAYTYLPGLRPFSAYVRVLDPVSFSEVSSKREHRSLGALQEACASVVMGEALGYLDANADYRLLTPSACNNTQTFALARAFVLGIDGLDEQIRGGWYGVRELTLQDPVTTPPDQVRGAWEVLSELASDTPPERRSNSPLNLIARACRELLERGDLRSDTWFSLTSAFGGMEEVRDRMALSRESRVKTFESILPRLARAFEEDPILAAFIAGYVGSRIAPGEMDHISLFLRPLPLASSALLWFCLCVGLQARGQVLSFAEGLGRRILRDLDLRDAVLGRPRSDIAFIELRVLFGREKKLSEFRTAASNALNVELAPGVTTSVRWPRFSESQKDLFDRRDVSTEARQLLSDLTFSLDRINETKRKLERSLLGGTPTQRYFPDKRSRK